MKQLFLVFNLLIISSLAFSQNPQEDFAKANEFYLQEAYGKAVQQYEQLLEDGFSSGELEFNLGNCYYQQNNVGQSILHYERALRFRPNDKDIRHNIALARERLQDDILENKGFFLKEWWGSVRDIFSSGFWSFLTILMAFAAVAGLLLWQFGEERKLRKKGFFGGIAALVFAGILLALSSNRAALELDSGEAIILAGETILRAAPEGNGNPIRELHAGTKVVLLDQLTDWHKVELANGEVGWLNDADLEKI